MASAIRVNCNSLWIGRVTSSLEAKALAEEFGAAAGTAKTFLRKVFRKLIQNKVTLNREKLDSAKIIGTRSCSQATSFERSQLQVRSRVAPC